MDLKDKHENNITALEQKRDVYHAKRQYKHAAKIQKEIEKLKQEIRNTRFKKKASTYLGKVQSKDMEFFGGFQQVQENWNLKLESYDKQTDTTKREMKRKNQKLIKQTRLEMIQEFEQKPVKFSKTVLNDRVIRDNLANQRKYEEAHKVNMRLQKLETLETSQHEQDVAQQINQKIQVLKMDLEKRLKIYLSKRKTNRDLMVMRQRRDFDAITKKHTNTSNVIEHNFILETQTLKKRKKKTKKSKPPPDVWEVSKSLMEFDNEAPKIDAPKPIDPGRVLGFNTSEPRFDDLSKSILKAKELDHIQKTQQLIADTKSLASELEDVFNNL